MSTSYRLDISLLKTAIHKHEIKGKYSCHTFRGGAPHDTDKCHGIVNNYIAARVVKELIVNDAEPSLLSFL